MMVFPRAISGLLPKYLNPFTGEFDLPIENIIFHEICAKQHKVGTFLQQK
jgi:hypothetical protein